MQTRVIAIIVLILVILGGFWLYNAGEPATPGDSGNSTTTSQGAVQGVTVNEAASAARADLAAKLGVSEDRTIVTKVEPKTWNDGCLGLGGAAESCLQALVEGYQVELEVNGATYVYRTDAMGAALRLEVGPKG